MTTLYERAVELEGRISDLKKAKDGADDVDVLGQRRKDVRADADGLRKAAQTFRALRSIGSAPQIDSAFVWQSVQHWESIGRAQEDDPTYLTRAQGIEAYRNQRRLLGQLITGMQQASRSAWEATFDGWLPMVDETLLGILSKIPRFASEVVVLRNALLGVASYRTTLPRSADEIRSIQNKCEDARGRWEKLVGHEFPDEVRTFFAELEARDGRVPLSLLTDAVHQWLDNEGILNNFYVSAG
jgi:hypothetical protein